MLAHGIPPGAPGIRQPAGWLHPSGRSGSWRVFFASWEKPEDDQTNIAWARGAWERLRRYSTGGHYVNFEPEDEGGDRTATAYGTNLERLGRLKATYDPQNLSRVNRNIAPAA